MSKPTKPFRQKILAPKQVEGEKHIKRSQSERIIAKFNGPRRMSEAMTRHGRPRTVMTIYLWMYPRNKKGYRGTGGLIPTRAWPDILYVARMEGILITDDDTNPRAL